MIETIISTVANLFRDVGAGKLKAEEAQAQIVTLLLQLQASIITAELKGESWLQRNWRPIMAISYVFIVLNNYLIVPYLTAFGFAAVRLDLPPNFWATLDLCLGGYVIGRSAKQITDSIITYKKNVNRENT